MAGLRPSFLPRCPTRPRGRGLQQPWSVGSGKTLRGLSASTQNSKWDCRGKIHWMLTVRIFVSSYFVVLFFFVIKGWTKSGKYKWTKGQKIFLLLNCKINTLKKNQHWKKYSLIHYPLMFLDGDLRQTLLLWEVQDHHHQHERFHDQERQAADNLHVQCWLPESRGRNVSALHFPWGLADADEFTVTLTWCKLTEALDCVRIAEVSHQPDCWIVAPADGDLLNAQPQWRCQFYVKCDNGLSHQQAALNCGRLCHCFAKS